MGDTFAIKDWPETFEFNDSRKIKGALKWVRFPCRQDSTAFVKLSRTHEGVTAIGVFNILVQVGARCPVRGVLQDDNGPWTPERFAERFGLHDDPDSEDAQKYLAFVKDSWARLARVGWLVPVSKTGDLPASPGTPGDLPDKRNKREDIKQQQQDSVVVVVENSLLRKALADVGIVGKTLDELAKTAIEPSTVRAEASKIEKNKGGTGALVNRLRELAANPAPPRPVVAPRPVQPAPKPAVDPETEKRTLRKALQRATGRGKEVIEQRLRELEGAA